MPIQVEIDAILVTKDIYIDGELVDESQTFLERGNHDWGNVDSFLAPNWDSMGLNLLGAPDNNYSFVGLPLSSGSSGGSGGTYQGYIIVFNN